MITQIKPEAHPFFGPRSELGPAQRDSQNRCASQSTELLFSAPILTVLFDRFTT